MLNPLPPSNDEFWEEGEKIPLENKQVALCGHSKQNWMQFETYIQEKNGAIVCSECGWGTYAPGYLKVKNGKILDLRSV